MGETRSVGRPLVSEDMHALHKLLRRNHAFVARTHFGFLRAVNAAFRPTPVPIIDAW